MDKFKSVLHYSASMASHTDKLLMLLSVGLKTIRQFTSSVGICFFARGGGAGNRSQALNKKTQSFRENEASVNHILNHHVLNYVQLLLEPLALEGL